MRVSSTRAMPVIVRVLVACAAPALSGCGGGDSGRTPTGPTPVTPPSVTLTAFAIGGPSTSSGQNTEGSVTLSQPAPAGGFVVSLASADPAVFVPASVTVAAGATTAIVPVLTRKVLHPATVTVTASAGDVSREATVTFGPGAFLSYASAGDRISGRPHSQRLTSDDHGFDAAVTQFLNEISVGARERGSGSSAWSLRFGVPSGEELRSGGIYSATATSPSSTSTSLSFTGFVRSCLNFSGLFVIMDVQYGHGPSLERLHAQFIQNCSGGEPLRGEVFLDGREVFLQP